MSVINAYLALHFRRRTKACRNSADPSRQLLPKCDSSTRRLRRKNAPVAGFYGSNARRARLEGHGSSTRNLKVYPGYPHGLMTGHADVIDPLMLDFIAS
ncbi:MAG: hypothetical protein ACOH2L_09020 [Devosia sp.]